MYFQLNTQNDYVPMWKTDSLEFSFLIIYIIIYNNSNNMYIYIMYIVMITMYNIYTIYYNIGLPLSRTGHAPQTSAMSTAR